MVTGAGSVKGIEMGVPCYPLPRVQAQVGEGGSWHAISLPDEWVACLSEKFFSVAANQSFSLFLTYLQGRLSLFRAPWAAQEFTRAREQASRNYSTRES